MRKLIRPTYPAQFSIGLLALIFAIAFFLSHQIFDTPFSELEENKGVYFGMFLVATAVVIMLLIIWEEFLFPIKVKEFQEGMVFRNHGRKLVTQGFIYLTIPAIFTFIYLEYDVKPVRFFIWAAVCIILPVLEKLASGVTNYNDFLKLTNEVIQYKNNEKEGTYPVKDIQSISIIKDEGEVLQKIHLSLKNGSEVTVDLDQMELDAFYSAIYKFMKDNYKPLLKYPSAAVVNN